MSMPLGDFDPQALAAVADRLDLREPNTRAIHTLALRLDEHYATKSESFEGVLDAATGVGKTYIIAGGIDYFASRGGRNFAIIAPGQTILTKTVAQFTQGTSKSLVENMDAKPVVITSENFNSPAMRADMDDPEKIKLYVFTVQSLIKPSTKAGRRTHEFQEGLGGGFYEHLTKLTDLIVFADEHHTYFGPSFSAAIRDLHPLALVGLTGTPHDKTPPEQIIFRYPLTAAIADELVKTPVIVGRRDDLNSEEIQLLDGVQLLETKQGSLNAYAETEGTAPLNAIMLVNCRDIAHAEEVGAFLTSDSFRGGAYADAVLVVHSDQSDTALAALDAVEEPGGPVRIIVQVGMLKEGWDVKTVYVVASLRASVSEILTEQTMGRGLRLPFGNYTGWEMLDTLDVLAHDSYEKVLAKAKALHESFIDHRTVITTKRDAKGKVIEVVTEQRVEIPVAADDDPDTPDVPTGTGDDDTGTAPVIRVVTQEDRVKKEAAPPPVAPRDDLPEILVPHVETVAMPAQFSLADIIDPSPYRDLGTRLATMPEDSLQRTLIGGEIVAQSGGIETVDITTTKAIDEVASAASLRTEAEARAEVITTVRSSPVVPGRKGQGEHVDRLIDWVAEGAGEKSAELLTRYPLRVATDIIALITRDQGRVARQGQTSNSVQLESFAPRPHVGRAKSTGNHGGKFSRLVAYTGWTKSLYEKVAFDSAPERSLAVLLDGDKKVAWWVRLERGDLPILWNGASQEYNPDFLVIDDKGDGWLIEVKADRDVERDEVQGKRQAALAWANEVNADSAVTAKWNYLLVSETQLAAAKNSWAALVSATKA